MDLTTEIVLLSIIVLIFVLAFVFRKNPVVKKYWKYLLILLPAAIILILKIIQDATTKKKQDQAQTSASVTQAHIEEIKAQISEVQTTAKVEAAIARTQNQDDIKKLEEIKKIQDDRERRQRICDMLG